MTATLKSGIIIQEKKEVWIIIVYNKLLSVLKQRNIGNRELAKKAGIAVNSPLKFQKNMPVSTETLNRVCEFLQVQPGDIMEWIPDIVYEERKKRLAEEQAKKTAEKEAIEAQIAELQAKLKNI